MLENMGVARRVIVRDTSIPLPDGMVLFSNDVLVSAESIVELLRTRDSEWDMICGLDLSFWG